MATVAFDTLKLARRLQSAGFSREQADGTAEALADTLMGEIATKSDLAELRAELKGDIAELANAMKSEFLDVRAQISGLGNEISGLRSEISGVRAELKRDIASLRTDMAKWIISAVFVNILSLLGVVAVLWQLAHK